MIRTHSKQWISVLALVLAFVVAFTTCDPVYAKTAVSKKLKTPDNAPKSSLVLERPVVSCASTTSSKVKLQWDPVTVASGYHIFRCKTKTGTYKEIGSTKKFTYTDKTVKAGQTYYYKVYAAGKNIKDKRVLSKFSKSVKVTTPKKKTISKTAYVGDSVMSGLDVYGIVKGSGKKVIYKVGVSAYNFYNGTPMDQLLSYNPDRMYIMLGMNSLVGSPSGSQMDSTISSYKNIIKACLKQNPDMQVVVLPVSPTRPSATVKNSSVRTFNSKLQSMAKELNVHYYDYAGFMKDSDGSLKSSYSAGDGIHWSISAYKKFKEELDSYGKNLS